MSLDDDDDDFDPRMTIGEHLEALRFHILKAVLYIAVVAVVCFTFQNYLMDWATWPHKRVQRKLIQEARVKDAPSDLQSLVGEVDARGKQLDKALAHVGREAAAARDKIEPTRGRLEALHDEQANLLAEAKALVARADELAKQDPPDVAALAKLEHDRGELAKRRAELKQRVSDAAGPFVDRFAKVPRFELTALTYQEPFLAYLKLALVAAIFIASPLVVYELWKFVGAGLYPSEKHYIKLFAPMSLVMFILGGVFGYFVLIPIGLYFLATYAPTDLVTTAFSMASYLSLFITMTVVVGLVFQLPLLMSFLTLVGFVNHEQFREYRGYAWVGGAIIAAILTPPDPFTQLLMLGPMGVLYEIGIFSSMMIGDRRKKADAEREAADATGGPPGGGGGGGPERLPAPAPASSADRADLLEDVEDPPGYDPDAELADDEPEAAADPDDPEVEIVPAPGAVAQGALDEPPAAAEEPAAEEPAAEEPAAGEPAAEEPAAEEPAAEEPAAEEPEEPTVTDGDNDDPTLDASELDEEVSDAPYRGPEAPVDDGVDDDEYDDTVVEEPYRGPEAPPAEDDPKPPEPASGEAGDRAADAADDPPEPGPSGQDDR